MTELPPGASPVDRIAPGTNLREWEVVRFLGRGSYAVVFEARRSSWLPEPHRALKVFDPIISAAARSALLSEFSALTEVRHPHLLTGIDGFDLVEPPFAGCVVFVLELADEDLSHRVARHGPLPLAEAASVLAEVAEGLGALHNLGRIHGDVKPENILRVGGRWALGDFGVTGLLEGSYALTAGTTIDYRPPEATDESRLHRSADVWALGVTLHVAATGRHPFRGADPLMRFAAAVRGDRVPEPRLDPALADLVDRGCLAPDPRARPTAPELARHLRALAAGPGRPDGATAIAPRAEPEPAVPTGPTEPPEGPDPGPGRTTTETETTAAAAPAGPTAAPAARSRPIANSDGRWAPALAAGAGALVTLAVTQVVAVVAGAAVDGVAARRTAYVVVSLALAASAVAGLARAAALDRPWRLGTAVVAAVVWSVATAALFGL